MSKTKFAFGYSCLVAATADTGVIAFAPSESREIVEIDLTAAATINVDTAISTIGDEVVVKVSSNNTARDLTFGTGITGPVLAGVINKTKVQSFVYDGSAFIATAAPVQID
jgi:uncharacterized protein (AIM24 family)